jgi:hypothetical protein
MERVTKLLLPILLAISIQPGMAQEKIWERPHQLLWVTLGGGFAGGSGFAGMGPHGAISFDSKMGLFSLRGTAAEAINVQPSEGEKPVSSIADLGLMYGLSSRSMSSFLSGSIGLAGTWVERESTVSTVGVLLEGQAFFIPWPVLGIGVKAYGNINPQKSIGGFLVCLHFSAFRTIQK